MTSILDSDMSRGIGDLLGEKSLRVPYYQRSYAWTKSQVRELYEDIRRALDSGRDYYFLGSVVACQITGTKNKVEIVDGQQRIATTAILLSAIRNHLLLELKEEEMATKFEERYLFHEVGFRDPVRHPSVILNETDDDFFQDRVINHPKPPERTAKRTEIRVPSHRLIDTATREAERIVKEAVGTRDAEGQRGILDKWVEFIKEKARVIFIVVDDPAEAYMIFETLNDRGLDLTVADLTKNYLFMKVGQDKVDRAKEYWSRMSTTLASSSDADITKTYIRHLWSSYNGVTRDKDLFREMRAKYDDATKALSFTKQLSEKSSIYAALGNSDSDFWNTYGKNAKRHLAILNSSLKVTQVKMLLLAVVDHFKEQDAGEIITCCVWWSVRFLIAGGSPGNWEAIYAKRAKAIREGKIKNAKELINDMEGDIPNDQTFEAAFASESGVTKAVVRYFLACCEQKLIGITAPHLAPDDPKFGDREHIMPQSPDKKAWPNLTDVDHNRLYDRIGNSALLLPAENSSKGNAGFAKAKEVYKNSSYRLTQEIAKHTGEWDESAIQARQERLAKLAVEIWPMKPPEDKKTVKKTSSGKRGNRTHP